MKTRITPYLVCSAVTCLLAGVSCGQEQTGLYPMVEPLRTGYLKVSDRHELYWEVCGNEKGLPVIVLHGGPGGSAGPDMRRYFDPDRFKVILFDQRGAGRSRPAGEWRENNTQVLVEDIDRLRDHLGVEGNALLFGGSWGTTLGLAYAETHPDRVGGLVLRGVFLGTRSEMDHFYHGGTAPFFPENFERLRKLLPEPERLDYPRQLFEMTQSDDPGLRERAVKGWAYYEIRMAALEMTAERCQRIVEDVPLSILTAFSVLENHYMMHNCFLEEGQLLEHADRIAHIPTFIVNGRYDVICPPVTALALANKLKEAKIEITMAGHGMTDRENTVALLSGVKWVADRMERAGR